MALLRWMTVLYLYSAMALASNSSSGDILILFRGPASLQPSLESAVESINDINARKFSFNYTTTELVSGIFGTIDANCFEESVPHERSKITTINCCSAAVDDQCIDVYNIAPSINLTVPSLAVIMEHYGWSQSVIFTEDSEKYLQIHNQLIAVFSNRSIGRRSRIIDAQKFNMSQEIFDEQPHIFVINSNFRAGLHILCMEVIKISHLISHCCDRQAGYLSVITMTYQAYHEGKYYPNYAWILIDWSDDSWKEYLNQETNCTESHITIVLERSLILTPYPNGEVTVSNDTYSVSDYVFDAVLLLALITDSCSLDISNNLVEFNSSTCVNQFIHQNSFIGATGKISFERRHRAANSVLVQQYINGSRQIVGVINTTEDYLQFYDNSVLWPDGVPPDGTPIIIVNILDWYVTFIGSFLMGTAFIFIIICLAFNIIYRNRKIVKLSSPNLNYIMMVGAIAITFSGIPLRTRSQVIQIIDCMIDRIAVSSGYNICFAVALVKIFRIHFIFKASPLKARKLQDWKLSVVVLLIFLAEVLFTIPLHVLAILNNDNSLVADVQASNDVNEQEVLQEHYIFTCGTTIYYVIYIGVVTLYKFILHGIGLVLAIKTRNIEIDVLNDYKYTAALIYSSSVLILVLAIVLPLTYNNPALDEPIFSSILFLILMVFLGLTFIPKFVALYKDPEGKKLFKKENKSATELG